METRTVLAAPPNEPICKSLALDLERRGFIVYVVVGSPEEEQMVLGESRVDIRPLRVDMTNVCMPSFSTYRHYSSKQEYSF